MKELCEAGRAKGKITLAVEKAYESICPAPARDYLEEKYQELLYLRGMVYRKDYDDPMWYKPEILNKYGIDHKEPRETVLKQVEKAYRELDARFVRMTGRRPYADEFFAFLRHGKEKVAEVDRPRPVHKPILRNPPSKGRKMGI